MKNNNDLSSDMMSSSRGLTAGSSDGERHLDPAVKPRDDGRVVTKNKQHLIWIDLEMTGLDPERDRILEIATIVTDAQLTILEEGPVFAIHQPQALLDGMDAWNTKQHNGSGLVKRVQESQVSEKKAAQQTLRFLSKYLDAGQSPMCGNSICQDRRFLCRYMPELARFFHYRNLDVSTLKELAARWRPEILKGIEKTSTHLALDDIRESIAELIYYREHFISKE